MITTTYKCDKCGNVQETPEQFWTIGVGAGIPTRAISIDRAMQVCRRCLENLGYHVKQPRPPNSPPPPTIEELIREILEIVNVSSS